jgi:hypothetical protein
MDGYDLTQKVCQLLFADDIVLLTNNDKELQQLLDILFENSITFRFFINYTKSVVLIFGDDRALEIIKQAYEFKIINILV